MRIALVGGGGSRTPVVYRGLIDRIERLGPVTLTLHDLDPVARARVERIIAGIDEELGGGLPMVSTTDLDTAVDGADFVLTAIRAGGFAGRCLDEAVPLAHGVLGQETVGPGGFALAVRNIPALQHIAQVMRRRAPSAWMINLSNPAGMATQALAPMLDGRVVGVCDSPRALARGIASAANVDVDRLHVEYAGLNHLGWVNAAWYDGRDLLPSLIDDDVLEQIEEARLLGTEAIRAQRALPNEYVYFYDHRDMAVRNMLDQPEHRGAFLQRQQADLISQIDEADTPKEVLRRYRESLAHRNDTYLSTEANLDREAGAAEDVFAAVGGYHEMALSVAEAIRCDRPQVLIVNTPNRGAVDGLDDDDVVEVPAVVRHAGVFPLKARLSPAQGRLVASVKEYEREALDAIARGSRGHAVMALSAHPLVPDAPTAERIIGDYLGRSTAIAEVLDRA